MFGMDGGSERPRKAGFLGGVCTDERWCLIFISKAIELLSIQISEPFARLTKSFKRERGLFVFRACQNLSRNRI